MGRFSRGDVLFHGCIHIDLKMQAWYAGPAETEFEKLVKTKPKLRALLEDSDFLPQLKAYNSKLLEYISSTPELVGEAIDYLVTPPKDTDTEARKHKYPLLSVEMVETETVSVLSSFFKPAEGGVPAHLLPRDPPPGPPVYLDLLFSLVDQCSPLPLLTGYFQRVCSVLLSTRLRETAEFFYSRPGFFRKLLSHLEDTNLANVAALFLNLDSAKLGKQYDEWRPKKLECVHLLLDRLAERGGAAPDGLLIQNITGILGDIPEKYYLIADGKELLDVVLSEKSVGILFGLVEKPNPLLSIPAASLLVALVNYYAFCSLNTEDRQNAELTQKNRERLESQPLVVSLVAKFEPLSKRFLALSSFTVEDFKVLELLCHCVTLSSPNVFRAVQKVNFFSVLLDLMAKFEQANILHGLIEKLFAIIFKTDRSIGEAYKVHLFCELDIILRSIQMIGGQQASHHKKGFFGHMFKIVKIYSKDAIAVPEIQAVINKYADQWKEFVLTTIKPYEDTCAKDLGSYDVQVELKPIEYRIKQTACIAPLEKSPLGEKMAEDTLAEEAKFMKSHTQQQQTADALEAGGQKNHIIESDTFFKLPIQEVLEEASRTQEGANSAASSVGLPALTVSEPTTPTIATSSLAGKELASPERPKADKFSEFLQQKKIEAGEAIKTQRSASQERRFTPNKGPKMASPSPRKKNSWTESEEDKEPAPAQPHKFFKKEEPPSLKPPVASLPHLPVAKKQLACSTIINSGGSPAAPKQGLGSTDPLAKSMDSILNIKNIKIKMSSSKGSEVKKCRRVEDKDLLLLNFLGIKVSK